MSNADAWRLGINVAGKLAAMAARGIAYGKVRAQMRNEIFTHALGSAPRKRLLKGSACARASFQPSQARMTDRTLPAISRRRQQNIP